MDDAGDGDLGPTAVPVMIRLLLHRRDRVQAIQSTQRTVFYAERTLFSHCHLHNPTPTPPVLTSNVSDASILGKWHETEGDHKWMDG